MIGKSYDVRSWADLMGRQGRGKEFDHLFEDSVVDPTTEYSALTNLPKSVSVDTTGEAGRPGLPKPLSQLEMFNA